MRSNEGTRVTTLEEFSPFLEPATSEFSVALMNKVVLVVDDSLETQRFLSRILTSLGLEVHCAFNGEEAIRLFEKTLPDVVLMDLQMPTLNGFDTTFALRAAGFKEPIIAVTADSRKETKIECLRNGFNGLIPKPVDRKHLGEMLHFSMSDRHNLGFDH
jgi:CheY-like chemotaxis protein